MIALLALLIAGTWIAVCAILALKTRRWLGIRPIGGLASFLLFLVLFFAPFIDHIVGMWQFEQLCKERAVVWVGPEAGSVRKAKGVHRRTVGIPGTWIDIQSHSISYVDVETDKPFIKYEGLHTKGGRIARLGLLDQTFTCWPKDYLDVTTRFDTKKLLEEGKKS